MVKKSAKYIFDTLKNLYFRSLLLINFACKGTRQKKKNMENSTFWGGVRTWAFSAFQNFDFFQNLWKLPYFGLFKVF